MKIEVAIGDDGTPEVTLSEVYSGVGVMTGMGFFGIAQRDGGIEILHGGKTVWTSREIAPLTPGGPGVRLPDGSGAFVASCPLPKTHWIYADSREEPPAPMRVGLGARRSELANQIRAAARYAVRGATMRGKEMDFDPDALVQNMVVGMLGYWTEDGKRSNRSDRVTPALAFTEPENAALIAADRTQRGEPTES